MREIQNGQFNHVLLFAWKDQFYVECIFYFTTKRSSKTRLQKSRMSTYKTPFISVIYVFAPFHTFFFFKMKIATIGISFTTIQALRDLEL